MNRIGAGVLLALIAIAVVSAQQTSETQFDTIQSVDYCDLRRDPISYNGRKIRISGIYARGFETSAFYSKTCIDDPYRSRHETWVDRFFGATIASDLETIAIVRTFRSGKAGGELEVTFVGVFRGTEEHGGFGHLNGSRFQIEVSHIEKAKLLPEEIGDCRRLDRTKPFHYLSYERIAKGTPPSFESSKRRKTEKLIYLRLANNSTCPIKVPLATKVEARELENESEIAVNYTLSSPCARVSWRAASDAKETFSILPPGKSIFFTVPLRSLTKEPYDLRVRFDSGTTKDSSFYQPFYFWRSDLPEGLGKDLDCTKY